jgi:hypothetical protein
MDVLLSGTKIFDNIGLKALDKTDSKNHSLLYDDYIIFQNLRLDLEMFIEYDRLYDIDYFHVLQGFSLRTSHWIVVLYNHLLPFNIVIHKRSLGPSSGVVPYEEINMLYPNFCPINKYLINYNHIEITTISKSILKKYFFSYRGTLRQPSQQYFKHQGECYWWPTIIFIIQQSNCLKGACQGFVISLLHNFGLKSYFFPWENVIAESFFTFGTSIVVRIIERRRLKINSTKKIKEWKIPHVDRFSKVVSLMRIWKNLIEMYGPAIHVILLVDKIDKLIDKLKTYGNTNVHMNHNQIIESIKESIEIIKLDKIVDGESLSQYIYKIKEMCDYLFIVYF